jgi:hypothetical protein
MDDIISTVVSGFGQLSTFVAQEVSRLLQSRVAQILAVQEACRALHANQQVLTGILQNQNGLVAPPYPPVSSRILSPHLVTPEFQSKPEAPLYLLQHRELQRPLHLQPQSYHYLFVLSRLSTSTERTSSFEFEACFEPAKSIKTGKFRARASSVKISTSKTIPSLLVTMVPRDRVYQHSASHPQPNIQPDWSQPQSWCQFPAQAHWW